MLQQQQGKPATDLNTGILLEVNLFFFLMQGCPVNKTVTWKENGEYLIKYRGEHLGECGKVQRIVDM